VLYAYAMELFIKLIADWLVIAVVLAGGAGFLILVKKDRYQVYARAILAGLVALLLAKVASLLYQGERPFVTLGEIPKASFLNNPGFPSDHALLVFTIAFVVWASTKNAALSAMLIVMGILVAFGRVVALVHTPVDVLGGLACALLAATIVYGKKLYSFK
jgi:membrane-associated phospholipid phosphatase